jgi:hypothetical protein
VMTSYLLKNIMGMVRPLAQNISLACVLKEHMYEYM